MKILLLPLLTMLQASKVWSQRSTFVYVQNNSDEEFTFDCESYDEELEKDSYWTCYGGTIGPGRREKVVRMNRNDGIKRSKTYHLKQQLRLGGKDLMFLSQKLEGTRMGSDLWQSIQGEGKWFGDSHNLHRGGNFGDFLVEYQAYAAAKLDHDIEYVIRKKKNVVLPSTDKDPDSINVVAYNTWLRPYLTGCKRAEFIPSHLEEYDVIIFSEVFNDACREKLLSLLNTHDYKTKVVDLSSDLANGGVMIASKYEITKEDQHVYRDACGGDDCITAKGVIYARIKKDGKNYHVFGTHAQADGPLPIPIDGGKLVIPDEDQSQNRAKQFGQMKDFITKMNIPSNEPVILGGDFNVERRNQNEYRKMLQILEASEPEVLKKNGIVSHDSLANDFLDSEKSIRDDLDYIFVSTQHQQLSGGFSKVHFVKHNPAFKPLPTDKDKWDLSDHFPVAAHLGFGSTRASVLDDQKKEGYVRDEF